MAHISYVVLDKWGIIDSTELTRAEETIEYIKENMHDRNYLPDDLEIE